MSLLELSLIAVGLSMDAFAVAICIGLSMPQRSIKKALIVGLYFGLFQAFMPLIGYFLASQFSDQIVEFDHWIAFILLAFIGGKMIKESFAKEDIDFNEGQEVSLGFKTMLPLALATSIDALAVGISFAFLNVRIIPAVSLIGCITLLLSMLGVRIGNVFGAKFKQNAELFGGIILILIGLKILLEHTVF
ncbi:MAG TPA: manganese efflux pump MntP family protein [Syntrophomonadaceae bacterium]|nr:manganese efflux pump MntP family protein [Syntrophomonadaceae bacterium]HQE22686.1 manganese efflux pump MntP family protein [Syntrophomonadaceae bacterium]